MGTLAVTGWIPYSSAQCQGHVGSYCYVPSWPVLNIDATRIYIDEPPCMQRPRLPFRVARIGGLVMESHPPALNHRVVE
jgi:hypothetical protein